MSIPYSTAAGLIFGKAGLQEFSEDTVKKANVLSLTKKVDVEADPELSALFPVKQVAVVEITTRNGIYTERVDFPKGEPENPLTDSEFKERYFGLMDYSGIEKSISERVFDLVYSDGTTINDLIEEL